ncbi:MAG: MFS transporter [Planctomycetes bacterium]|nr:MFS transporter [Planctomycetota bacterium]
MNADTESTTEPDPRRWIALFAALTAPFLGVLDFFVVNLALPQIGERLGATFAQQQLVIAFYATSYAVFVVTGGRLGDTYGRRRVFLLGLGGFVGASLLCGIAPNPWSLIAARFAQGFAAALAFPQVLALVHVTFPEYERPKALAYFGLNVALASIAGQMLGGFLVHWNLFDLGWRVLFLINLPIGGVALWIAARTLPEARAPNPPTLDWGGVVIATAALVLFLVPVIEGQQAGWPAWSLVMLIASVPVFAWFVRAERRAKSHGRDPLIDLALFKLKSFRVGLGMIAAYFFGGGSLFLILSIYEQRGLGLDTLQSALTFLGFAVALLFSSLFVSHHVTRYRTLFLHGGFALVCTGMALLVLGLATAPDGDARTLIVIGLSIYGVGQGCVAPIMYSSAISGVPLRSAGAASGVLSTCQQVSAAVGVALIGLIFAGVLAERIGPEAHAQAAMWALCVNFTSMVVAAVLAWRLPNSRDYAASKRAP